VLVSRDDSAEKPMMSVALAVRVIVWLWLFAALAAGYFGVLQKLPLPAVQGILVALTGALVLAYRTIAPFRRWIGELDLRALVLLHVTRFVGFYLIALYRKGILPYAFAVPAGVGDVAVAVLALVVAFYPFSEAARPRAIYIWNVVGLIDILLVVFSAARIGLTGSRELYALTYLPLSLLPTFLVPLIIASHLAIFARLGGMRR
jgi:hypothetical protein